MDAPAPAQDGKKKKKEEKELVARCTHDQHPLWAGHKLNSLVSRLPALRHVAMAESHPSLVPCAIVAAAFKVLLFPA